MADLKNFSITRIAAAQMTVPRWQISGQITNDREQQNVIRDFTGANAVIFPTVLGQLTNAQQDELVEGLVMRLLFQRFGGDFA